MARSRRPLVAFARSKGGRARVYTSGAGGPSTDAEMATVAAPNPAVARNDFANGADAYGALRKEEMAPRA